MPLTTPKTPIAVFPPPRETTITWIAVADELPDTDTTVLVHIPKAQDEPVWFGYYDSETGFWRDTDGSRFRYPVTHWSNLPEPPTNK